MKSPAFQFYPDDFVGGVADMTQAEVGAYILLLCAQWGRGEVPLDSERAALIAKGPVSAYVMRKFPSGKNPRLERVRANQDAYREAQAENGKAGADKRWGRHSTANGVAVAVPSPENSDPTISPMARNCSPSPSPSPSPVSDSSYSIPAVKPLTIADHIYSAYPRKVGRKAAINAIRSALRVKTPEQLLEAVKAYSEAVDRWPASERNFVPHPATWFNRGSYDDDRSTWERTENNDRRASFA